MDSFLAFQTTYRLPTWYSTNLLSCLQRCVLLSPPFCLLQRSPTNILVSFRGVSSSPFHEFLARQIYLSITDSTRQIHSEVLLPISLLCCSINTLCCTYPLCELCIYNRRSDPTDDSMSNPDPFQELVDNLRRVLVSSPSTTTSSAPLITSSMARPTWYSTNLLSCLQRCVLLSPPSCLLQWIYQSPSDVWAPFH